MRIALALVAVLALGAGTATAAEPAGSIDTAITATPEPTPQIIERVIEKPVTVTVPQVPADCLDALDAADNAIGTIANWIDAVANGQNAKADRLVNETETALNAYFDLSIACRATATNSSY